MKKQTHKLKTWMPYFQDIIDGKKPFEIRFNDRNFEVGDDVQHIEWDSTEDKATGRQCWTTITYMIKSGLFGIPEGYCLFAQHTTLQTDFIRDFKNLDHLIKQYEDKLSYRMGSDIAGRLSHVLSQFNKAATEAAWKGKNFLEDVKTQFKAIELTLEGVTSEAYNHGQKRVIANHVINILRNNIDKIDRVKWDFQNSMYDHFNYFRSESPEGDLLKRYRDMVEENKRLKETIAEANNKLPEDQKITDLPF